ncbi:MAG: response regulator [Acidobacteria bacterium]|nr:response regulator [Acidobacteriota bacterium]
MKAKTTEATPPGRILYVEDHQDSREMLTLILETAGYEVSTADSLADGVRLADGELFDLYILDSRYDDGSGLDLCRQIRARDPLTPIIFYSGLAYPADIAAGIAAGAQHYLTKPLGILTMNQTIAKLFANPATALVQVASRQFFENETPITSGFVYPA